jgi:hypothetical protein
LQMQHFYYCILWWWCRHLHLLYKLHLFFRWCFKSSTNLPSFASVCLLHILFLFEMKLAKKTFTCKLFSYVEVVHQEMFEFVTAFLLASLLISILVRVCFEWVWHFDSAFSSLCFCARV